MNNIYIYYCGEKAANFGDEEWGGEFSTTGKP